MKDEEIRALVSSLSKVVDSWEHMEGDTRSSSDIRALANLGRQAIRNIERDSHASFKYVDKKYVGEVRSFLLSASIPHVEVPGVDGAAFVVAASEEGAFLEVQSEAMFNKMDFVRYCTPDNIIRSAAEMGYKDVVRMSFTNALACKVALQELYKFRIPTAVIKRGEEFLLYIHPEYLYRNGEADFSDFRLRMAMYEAEAAGVFGGSKSQLLVTKLKQVKYDDEVLDKFAEAVKDGKPSVYGDAFAKSPCYLESKSGSIVVSEKIDGEWVQRPIKIDGGATVPEIKKLCMSYLAVIKNAAVMPRKLWNAKFKSGAPDKTDEDVTSIMKERPKYSKEVKPFYKLQSTKLQAAVDAVLKEASERTEKKVGIVSVTNAEAMKEAYGLKSEEIAELLEEGTLPEIEDFLEDDEEMSEKQKIQWLMELMNAYDGTKDKPILEFSHKIVSHEAAKEEMARTAVKERDERTEVKE